MKKIFLYIFIINILLNLYALNTPHQLINSTNQYPIIYTFVFPKQPILFIGLNDSYISFNYIKATQDFTDDLQILLIQFQFEYKINLLFFF